MLCANITWRQDVGGSSIEASKIAGQSKVERTLDYTIVGLKRQYERAKAAHKTKADAAQRPASR